MTTPTLELHLKAEGVEQVEHLTRALTMLNGAVGDLGKAKAALSQLKEIGTQLMALRVELKQGLDDIKKALTEGMQSAFSAAASATSAGTQKMASSFDEGMKKVINEVNSNNEKIAKKLTELNAGSQKAMGEAGAKAGKAFAEGVEQEASKVKIRIGASVSLGNGAKAGLSIAGLDNLPKLIEEKIRTEATPAAQKAVEDLRKATLEKLRAKSAANVDPRELLGLPSRDAMKSMGIEIAAQLRAGVAAENLRAKSALSVPPEVLLGLPSREETKSLSRQIAAQMREGIQAEALRAKSASSLDPRTLLGLPSRDEMKSMGAQLAAQLRDGVKTDALRAKSAGSISPRELLGLPSREEMKAFTAQLKAEMAEALAVANMLDKAYAKGGMYSSIAEGSRFQLQNLPRKLDINLDTLRPPKTAADLSARLMNSVREGDPSLRPLDETIKKAPQAQSALKALANQMADTHSAARGLASGFGLLWLTWGNLLPLLAGAAVSNAFVQTIKLGAEVQNTFTSIRVLAGESAESVGRLNTQMLEMSRNSQFGPTQIAEAMKTLALAGLNAEQVFSAVKDVLNFAVAGDTDIKQAADVMTTVATAFGISAQSYAMVGDIIAKAAAESKSSVESMGSAFKTASVINQQYGVSLEDTAIGLSLLANAGIQGTAAGTALRNMYADLAGRTPKVTKALKDLGVEALDPLTGKMKSQAEIFDKLMKRLSEFKPAAQFKYIQDIFSERGGKEALAILTALQEKAKEAGSTAANAYAELAQKIGDAAGFTANAAAQMALTPLNQMKSVAASLQATLVETFDEMQPVIIDMAAKLKQVFNSEDFKETLKELVTMLGKAITFVVDHMKGIGQLLIAYAGLRAVPALIGGITLATEGWAAATALGITTVAGASRAAMIANPLLTALAAAITIGATAWGTYQLWAGKAQDKQTEMVESNSAKMLLQNLQEEEDRLLKVNEARALGITLMELEARAKLEKVRAELPPELVAAKKELAEFDARQQALQNPVNANLVDRAGLVRQTPGGVGGRVPLDVHTQARRAELAAKVTALEEAHGEVLLQAERTAEHNRLLRAEADKAEKERLADKKTPKGDRDITKANKLLRDNTQSTAMSQYREEEHSLENHYKTLRELLESKHKNELISEGSYQAQLQQVLEEGEKKELALTEATGDKVHKEYLERRRAIRSATNMDAREREQAVENLDNTYLRDIKSLDDRMQAINDAARLRTQKAIDDAQGDQLKASKKNDLFWAKELANAKAAQAAAAVGVQQADLPEDQRAKLEAEAKVTEKYADDIAKLQKRFDDTTASVEAYNRSFDEGQPITEASLATVAALQLVAQGAQADLQKALSTVQQIREAAGQAAKDEVLKKKSDELAKSVTSGLADAILKGGKGGFQSLKDWVKNTLFREPIKVMLEGVLKPIGNMVAKFVYGDSGSSGQASVPGGGPSLPNGGSALGGFNIGGFSLSQIGFLGQIAMGGAMVGSTIGQMMGLKGAQLQVASIGGSLLGGIPGALLGSLVKPGGGPKTEGKAGPGMDWYNAPNHSGDAQAEDMRKTLQGQFDAIAQTLGSTVSGIQFGVGFGQDPKGNAPSSIGITASKSGSVLADAFSANVGRSDGEFQAAFAAYSNRVMLQALQASHIDGLVGDYIKSLGDIATMEADKMQAAVARIQKIATEKATLDETWFNLTHDANAQLQHQREKELESLDDLNKAQAYRVYALQDAIAAEQKRTAALKEANSVIDGVRKNVGDYLDRLKATPDGLLTPQEQRDNARSQFERQVAAARAGNRDAAQSLTTYAGQLADAQKAYGASGPETMGVLAYIQQTLSALPDQLSPEAFIATAVDDSADQITSKIDELIKTADANSKAQIDALNAKMAADAALLATSPTSTAVTAVSAVLPVLLPSFDLDAVRQSASYAVGTNYVPYDMLAQIHKGERITPASDNPYANPYTPDAALRGPIESPEVTARLDRLTEMVERLVAVSAAGFRGTIDGVQDVAKNTEDTADAARRAPANRKRLTLA